MTHGSDEALRLLTQQVLQQVLEMEMDEHLQAETNERTDERKGDRNGHDERQFQTRVGTLELRVPRDRSGDFSTALFERYTRAERALVVTLMEMVVQGVSPRRVQKITDKLCGTTFSKSTVSRDCEELDEIVTAWKERPLERNYPFVLVDALEVRVREDGQVRPKSRMLAMGVDEQGYRRVLGCELGHAEDFHHWRGFLRRLVERGLSGVEWVTSDAHAGLVRALRQVLGGVVWQRCQTHFRRNVTQAAPAHQRDALHEALDAILKADSKEQMRAKINEVLERLEGRCDKALECLEQGWEDACAILSWPSKYRKRLRTTNMVERCNEELRRRDKVIRIYPNLASVYRTLGARLMEMDEEWSTGKRYLKMQAYEDWKRRQEASSPQDDLMDAAAE